MAEETDDSRFKSEVMNLLSNLIVRTNETASDIKVVKEKIDSLDVKLQMISGQFNDVGLMAIEDHKRVDNIEKRVSDLEAGVH